jgi:hypothetical protein
MTEAVESREASGTIKVSDAISETPTDAASALDDLDDIEFVLEEIENKIAPLALA